ncbi:MAG TPA: putative glycoside hydrolase [Gaiella sp.]|uniref:putative glycoside hydrolase n=1 Tax=Gaiella sp. TaxID=2663207 RepID=UPI002D7F451E|nr:putative glycoside hydrolase [Gaiella sp.]HET9285986.1 putative glycoside hydrolase [Gaiella sp.]
MLYPSLDPNERFRARRDAVRRRKRRRRAAVAGLLLLAVLALAAGMTLAGKSGTSGNATSAEGANAGSGSVETLEIATRPRPLPVEVRGVHVTGALASLPGKLDEYMALTRHGLNTIELDIKDEGGEIAFAPSGVPLAKKTGAVRSYYDPRKVARRMHRKGIYLIGRVVVFQDPYLARARPDLAVRRSDGSLWTTNAGLGWVNPYDRRVWEYSVSVAAAAARAGFDEIMLDYVRFPSDGDVGAAVYPGKTSVPRGRLIAGFTEYAKRRLAPLGVRVSTALFGLSATRDMRLGQVPRWISAHMDQIHPMAYPALYGGGELGIPSPSSEPGETVFRTLIDFKRELKGSRAQLIPWIQDWNYAPEQVMQQVRAARLQGAKGYLLWNASGLYTKSALAPPS